MRNKIIIGTLILSTAFQATIPAYASKESAGNVIGGVVGGLIGSQIGKGSRHGGVNGVGMILGAITGSIIGGVIGRELDEADRKAFYDAQMQGLNGGLNQRCEWNGSRYGSRTGVSGNFTTLSEGYNFQTGEYCRSYISVMSSHGRTEETRGVACSRLDGSWYEVKESQVRFNGKMSGGYEQGHRGHGGHKNHNEGFNQDPKHPGSGQNLGQGNMGNNLSRQQSNQLGDLLINNVSRRNSGEVYRVLVQNNGIINQISIQPLSAAVRVHEALIYTDLGRRIPLQGFSRSSFIPQGRTFTSEFLNLSPNESVIAFDLRIESMGGIADVLVHAVSNRGQTNLIINQY